MAKQNNGFILAIDLGSTFFKAGLFDAALRPLGTGAAALEYAYGPHGEVELTPATVDTAFRKAVRQALKTAGITPPQLAAMAITSQAQTFAVVGGDGSARGNFISWLDTRAGATCQRLQQAGRLTEFGRHTSFGALLAPLQICQLAHLRKTAPRNLRPQDRALLLPSYFALRLTGRAAVDDNLAAMSGLYSLERHAWWPEALHAAGITTRQLPAIVPIGSRAATSSDSARRWGLCAGIPLVLAGNDQTAGAFGARIGKEGAVLITLGTAQVAYRVCQTLPRSDAALIRGPYPGGRWYRMAADSCGGSVVNWAKTVLAGCQTDAALFEAAARAKPGCNGLVFRIGLPDAPNRWEGIGPHHTAGDFARSTLEALVARLAGLVRDLGLRPDTSTRIMAAGGGSRQPLWLRLVSEALDRPIRPVQSDPLAGAARMASLALASPAARLAGSAT